jgi:hypothetical protein
MLKRNRMTSTFRGLAPALAVLLALLMAAAPCAAQTPSAFEVRLEILRNGKALGESVFTFTSDAEKWRMDSETHGTHGLARFIRFTEASFSEGEWLDGAPRPLRFERKVKAVISRDWSADFDWQEGVVRTEFPDGEATLELQPGVLDETATGLRIRTGLSQGEDDWHLQVVDEDEIENEHFGVRAVERIQTALGCMEAYRVDKIRDPDNPRYTRTWYASEHDFVPVRMQHGKKDGDLLESRLLEIKVDGKAIAAGPDC